MATWSYFYPRLMPRVMGCPVPVANTELRNSCREFFERTRAWRQWLDPFTVYEDIREYDLDPPIGASVYRIEQATKDGSQFGVGSVFSLPKDPAFHTGAGDGLASDDRMTVRLLNELTAGSVIQIQASLVPSDTSVGIPDHIAGQFAEGILAGARFRIRTIVGQPFTDPASAAVDLAKFEAEVGRVQADVFRSHTNSTPRRRPTWC